MYRSLLFLILLFYTGSSLYCQITPSPAQTDTTLTNDPIRQVEGQPVNVKEIDTYADQFVPRKASLYSAIVPGMGQAYNKSYWKIPIIYGGFVALGYTIDFYNNRYQLFRSELFTLLEENSTTTPLGLSESQVRSQIDRARRERDFYMIMTGVLYMLQIAEAHIDAHLKEFKLNPDLQVSIEPSIERTAFTNNGYSTGVSLILRF